MEHGYALTVTWTGNTGEGTSTTAAIGAPTPWPRKAHSSYWARPTAHSMATGSGGTLSNCSFPHSHSATCCCICTSALTQASS